jgi:hypothetical protein
MDVRTCPRCGAPLRAGAPGTVEACRFCGAEGSSRSAPRSASLAATHDAPRVCAEGETVATLCDRFVASVRAYVASQSSGVDEPLMRAIEDRVPIPDDRRDEFRREIVSFVEALAVEGRVFDAQSNRRVRAALELTLSEDLLAKSS